MKLDEAIVLVGGLGTRLRAVTGETPKPLVPVAGRPFLAWVLDRLDQAGLRRVVLAASYRSDEVERVIGRRWRGMAVDYSIEASPMGTGGAVRQACEMLHGDAVHVLNGDTFLEYTPADLSTATLAAGASIGVALAQVADVATLPDRLQRRIAQFLAQAPRLSPAARERLAGQLAHEASGYVSPLPHVEPELFLAGVAALRRQRDAAALELTARRLERLRPVLHGRPHGFPER